MKYPPSQRIGIARAPDGAHYSLEFYGEDEGAAVVVGPSPPPTGRVVEVPEVHREPAHSPDDARAKLLDWCRQRGWTIIQT